jgi:uncharacterized membrane protein YjfL (UPF0719 family)
MNNKMKGMLMQIPVILLLLAGTITSLVLKFSASLRASAGVSEMSIWVFILFLFIDILYFWGIYLVGKPGHSF